MFMFSENQPRARAWCVTSIPTVYLYDGDNTVSELDNGGNVLAKYTAGQRIDEPLAEMRSGTASFYEQDGLGSVASLSNGTGALSNTYAYDSFGNVTGLTATVTNPFRYTGREFDPETGIYEYRARYLDPTIGRFVSEDPIGLYGGINSYGYAFNNPVVFSDPLGLCPPDVRELCRRAANSRYVRRMLELKSENNDRSNEVAIESLSESFFLKGVERFLEIPITIEFGLPKLAKVVHRYAPIVESAHAAVTVKKEVDVIREQIPTWKGIEADYKHDLELCDSQ